MSNMSWIFIIIIGAGIGIFALYRQGRLPWLKGIKIPKMFEQKADTQIEKLRKQTEKEVEKAEELRSVLEAKKGLATVKAENIRLQKAIDGVSEKSVEREKRDEKKAQDARNVKPKRL